MHGGHNNCILVLQTHERSITYICVWAKIASQLHVVASVCYSAITCSSGVVVHRGAPELVGHPVAKEDGKTQHNDLYREHKP